MTKEQLKEDSFNNGIIVDYYSDFVNTVLIINR